MRENGLVSKGGRKKRSSKPKKTPAEYVSENLFREIRKSFDYKDIKPNTYGVLIYLNSSAIKVSFMQAE